MTNTKDEAVVFLNAAGEEISNDPRWLARKTLEQAGESDNAKDARIAELEAKIAELEAAKTASTDESGGVEEDDNPDQENPYASVKGDDLKVLAKDRGISLRNDDGTTKRASQVRDELAAQDIAKA